MIPILYKSEETAFASQGIGALTDCLRCEVTEERNGPYTLELDYPITGKWYSEIQEGRLVTAWHDDRHDAQPFEIYARTAPISGIVTFYGRHISYRLNHVIVGAFQASTAAAALAGLKSHAMTECPFTFWTDKDTAATFRVRVPSACRSLLGGIQGSILDTFGGEYMFDRFAVRLYAARGADEGVVIEYGKNLTDLVQDKSIETMYTAAAPYWTNADGTEVVTIPGLVVAPELETKRAIWTTQTGEEVTDQDGTPIDIRYGIIRAVPMDLSGDFDEAPSEEQLRDLAQRRLNNSTAWQPKDGLRVSFAQLWQTEEYKDIAPLERVALCDIVTVHHRALGVSAKMKVTRVVYDTLRERYASMELGTTGASLAQTIRAETEIALQERPTRSVMAEAIDHATELIRGGLGGYVVIGTDEDGQPDEILIMDAPTIAEAVNVWRFNKGGLGHSSTGYNGPYNDIALTADGQINADAITTGTLNANLIKAGVIQSPEGENYWNLATDELVLRKVRLDIQTNDQSYDVIDIRGRNGQWQNKITPLQILLMSEVSDKQIMIQAGGIWGYADADGTENPLHIQSDGAIWLGGDGHDGRVYIKDTNGQTRTTLNVYGLTLTDASGTNHAWFTRDYFQYGADNAQRFAYQATGSGNTKAIYLADENNVLRTRLFDSGYLELRDSANAKQVGLDSSDGDLWLGALGTSGGSVADAINELMEFITLKEWNTTYNGITIRAMRRGGSVTLAMVSSGTTAQMATTNAYVTFCTLPEEYRPPRQLEAYIITNTAWKGQFNLDTAGELKFGYTRQLRNTSNGAYPASTTFYVTWTYTV